MELKSLWWVRRGGFVVATVALTFLLTAASAVAATVTVTVTTASADKTTHQSKRVTLRQGDTLRIAFKGNWYDSGYSWKLTLKPRDSVLRSIGSKTIGSSRCCGSPEPIYYSYDAVGHGMNQLRYTLTRFGAPPKGSGEPTVTVTAQVQPRK
jgi:predicted secreted protein